MIVSSRDPNFAIIVATSLVFAFAIFTLIALGIYFSKQISDALARGLFRPKVQQPMESESEFAQESKHHQSTASADPTPAPILRCASIPEGYTKIVEFVRCDKDPNGVDETSPAGYVESVETLITDGSIGVSGPSTCLAGSSTPLNAEGGGKAGVNNR